MGCVMGLFRECFVDFVLSKFEEFASESSKELWLDSGVSYEREGVSGVVDLVWGRVVKKEGRIFKRNVALIDLEARLEEIDESFPKAPRVEEVV